MTVIISVLMIAVITNILMRKVNVNCWENKNAFEQLEK